MIDRSKAQYLVKRFAGKQGFPKDAPEALEALIDAMERSPCDEAHAARIAEELEVEAHFCPEPSEVWRMARITGKGVEVGCERCKHTAHPGWMPFEANGSTGVKPCVCRQQQDEKPRGRRSGLTPVKEIKIP